MPETLYITADVPPIGGRIRERAEDFFVDEQPLYLPSGKGEHIYLLVEKRNLSTLRAARILAAHFGVHVSAIGYAGLKDKVAVTRQVFSVHLPGTSFENVPMLRHERMAILWADRHTNKLRRGHLAGNRFSIKIRGVQPTTARAAHRIMSHLERSGVPNWVGQQRFGYTGRNHLVGSAMLRGDAAGVLDALLAPAPGIKDSQHDARELYIRGDYAGALERFFRESRTERRVLGSLSRGASPEKAMKSIERDEEQFFLTAFQSAVFNDVLAMRIGSGTFATLAVGDVAFKHDNRALFSVGEGDIGDDLAARLARFEISPSGPMWGARMKRAAGAIDRLELNALERTGISLEMLAAYDERRPHRITGERRPLRVRVTDVDVEGGVDEHGTYVRLAFDLPRGAFATAVVQEVIKPPPGAPGPAGFQDDDEDSAEDAEEK